MQTSQYESQDEPRTHNGMNYICSFNDMKKANAIHAALTEIGLVVEMVKKPEGWGYHAHLYTNDETLKVQVINGEDSLYLTEM